LCHIGRSENPHPRRKLVLTLYSKNGYAHLAGPLKQMINVHYLRLYVLWRFPLWTPPLALRHTACHKTWPTTFVKVDRAQAFNNYRPTALNNTSIYVHR